MDHLRMALDHSGMVGLFNKESINDELDGLIIYHELCSGAFNFRQISKKENALFCPDCGGRITFPSKIRTTKQLNRHLYLKGIGTNPAVISI